MPHHKKYSLLTHKIRKRVKRQKPITGRQQKAILTKGGKSGTEETKPPPPKPTTKKLTK